MATQEKFWIVKWMPEGTDISSDGCRYLRGDTNKVYETIEAAEERAMHIASEARREVGVFELVAAFRPPLNVERVEVRGKGQAQPRKRAPAKKKAPRKR